jgi:type I restriction enzyme R subunit
MRDHTLFQAICRTNRLDGDDKDYGHIVDFKELFQEVQNSIAVYTSEELDTETCGSDANIELKDWLKEGRKKLDEAREALHHLCEPVPLPREQEHFLRYFCGDAAQSTALTETEPLRISFYKATATFLRAYADIAQNLDQAGYTDAEIDALEKETAFYAEIRAAIKKHSGEELDIKPYEADMRHLINTYIQADPATDLGNLSSLSLTQLIIETGIHDAIAKKLNQKGKLSKNAIAEGIINNVRKTIIRDQLTDPRFYAEMSKLLDDLIKQARTDAADYEKFLQKAEELVRKLVAKTPSDDVPAVLHGNKEATVIFNNLPTILANPTSPMLGDDDEVQLQKRTKLALEIDRAMREMAPAGWKEDIDGPRGRQVLNALFPILDRDRDATRAIFEIIRNQPGY